MRVVLSASIGVAVVFSVAACGDDQVNVVKNRPPLAVAGVDQHASRGAVVNVNGQASTDPDGRIVSFTWDFGDGTTVDGDATSHIYNAGGTFTVTLTVVDDKGAEGQDELVVTVDDNLAPVAVINVTPAGDVGALSSVRFDGTSSTDADGTIAAFDWDFGDGDVGTGPTFDHAFAAAGTYDVGLTVTDDKGATNTAHVTMNVTEQVSYAGQWSWTLVDPSQRDMGLVCGTFEDSMLTILVDIPAMTITENAGGTNVTYSGSLTDVHFDVTNEEFGIVQEIVGDFDSPTSFTGFYKIDPGFGDGCDDRAVIGTKVSD